MSSFFFKGRRQWEVHLIYPRWWYVLACHVADLWCGTHMYFKWVGPKHMQSQVVVHAVFDLQEVFIHRYHNPHLLSIQHPCSSYMQSSICRRWSFISTINLTSFRYNDPVFRTVPISTGKALQSSFITSESLPQIEDILKLKLHHLSLSDEFKRKVSLNSVHLIPQDLTTERLSMIRDLFSPNLPAIVLHLQL